MKRIDQQKIIEKNTKLFYSELQKHTRLSIYCQHCIFRDNDYCEIIKAEADPQHPHCAIKTKTVNY